MTGCKFSLQRAAKLPLQAQYMLWQICPSGCPSVPLRYCYSQWSITLLAIF